MLIKNMKTEFNPNCNKLLLLLIHEGKYCFGNLLFINHYSLLIISYLPQFFAE
jgi:hypothetical protein